MGRNPMVPSEPKNRTYGLIVLTFGVAAMLLAIIAVEWRARARQEAAEDLAYAWCAKLESEREETGKWKRRPDDVLPEHDPWGNPLRVRYEATKYSEKMTVSSDGPDRKQWTRDDITWSVANTNWIDMAREGAVAVEEVAGAASRGVVGGAIEGVTDHIPKPLRDKMGIPSERDDKKEAEKK